MKCWLLEGGPRPTTALVTQARVRAGAGTQSQAQLPTHSGQECLWAPGERMEQIARSAPRRLCTLPALQHCQEAGRWPAQKDCLETCARARLHNFCRLKKTCQETGNLFGGLGGVLSFSWLLEGRAAPGGPLSVPCSWPTARWALKVRDFTKGCLVKGGLAIYAFPLYSCYTLIPLINKQTSKHNKRINIY